jgi:hypothetical protein
MNLLSDQLFSIDSTQLPQAFTEALYDGIYETRKNRLILIDKGILYWRGRTFPLQIELDLASTDTDLVKVLGEKDLFGKPVRWGTSWSSPTLNFYQLKRSPEEYISRKSKPFLSLLKLPEHKILWPTGDMVFDNSKQIDRFLDRVTHLIEAEDLDLLAEYIGHENIIVIHKNWREQFKSPRVLKWRLKSVFTKKIIATILEQKDKPITVKGQTIELGDGSVVIEPTEANKFKVTLYP